MGQGQGQRRKARDNAKHKALGNGGHSILQDKAKGMIDCGTGQRAGEERTTEQEIGARYCGSRDMVQRKTGMTGQPVFLLGRSDKKSDGAASQWNGAASQNGTQSICKNIPCCIMLHLTETYPERVKVSPSPGAAREGERGEISFPPPRYWGSIFDPNYRALQPFDANIQ